MTTFYKINFIQNSKNAFIKIAYFCTMIFDSQTAKQTAELLLQIKAIKLQPNEPFTWASGWKSPIYCDNRLLLSYPPIRNYVRSTMAKHLEDTFGKPDVIAGVATGAIGIGILVAEYLGLPFIYVRPEAKGHGHKNQIEGKIDAGQNVVVVEDLISTGKSSLNAVQALKEANVNVKGMVAIFSYGFETASKNFKKENIALYTLSDYENLLSQALKTKYITPEEKEVLAQWNANPSEWDVK